MLTLLLPLKGSVIFNQNQTIMGKGDKKSRRGKIILGSYGIRRPRKIDVKPEISPVKVIQEKKSVKEVAPVPEVKEIKVVKEKTETKPPKAEKEKKALKEKKVAETTEEVKESKPKKEKKN